MKKNFTRNFRNETPDKTEIYFYNGVPYAMYDAVTSDVHLALPYEYLSKPENYKFSLGFKGFIRLKNLYYSEQRTIAEHWANVLFGKPLSPEMEAEIKKLWEEMTNPEASTSNSDRAFAFVKQDYHDEFDVNFVAGGVIKKNTTITDRSIVTRTWNDPEAIKAYCDFWGVKAYTKISRKPFCITQQLARDAYNMYTCTSSWRSAQQLGVCIQFDKRTARINNQVGTLLEANRYNLDGECLGTKLVLNTNYHFNGYREVIVAHPHPLFKEYQEKQRWSNSLSSVATVVDRICGLTKNGDGKLMYEGDEPLEAETITVIGNLTYRMANPNNEYADSPLVRVLLNKEPLEDVLKDVHIYIEVHEHYCRSWKNDCEPMERILEFSGNAKKPTVPRYSLWPKTAKTVVDWLAETTLKDNK